MNEPVIYRYQVDVIVLAKSQEEAEKAIRIGGPHCVRGVTWTAIRDGAGWVNPAWRVERDGDVYNIEPKRKRQRGTQKL